jgi:transcriptional regulator with XRE-family HTH domain
MHIGARIRDFRMQKGFSQRDIEARTGLMAAYISRIENGYKRPSLKTLQRFAAGLEVPLYRFFYDGEEEPEPFADVGGSALNRPVNAGHRMGKDARFIQKLQTLCGQLARGERQALLTVARSLARRQSDVPRKERDSAGANSARANSHLEALETNSELDRRKTVSK